MDEIRLYCRGNCCGEAVVRVGGERLEIRAEMDDPGDGLYRAVLVGDRGEISLGVMEPRDGKLVLCRRPALCDVVQVERSKGSVSDALFRSGRKALGSDRTVPVSFFLTRLSKMGWPHSPASDGGGRRGERCWRFH